LCFLIQLLQGAAFQCHGSNDEKDNLPINE